MPEQSTEFVEITRAIFELLEEVALDERLERYLHLDEFYAVDGPGLETARHITEAWVEGCLESGHGFRMAARQRLSRESMSGLTHCGCNGSGAAAWRF